MAESEANPAPEDVHEEDTNAPGYKPPEFEPLENILKKDQEDESLNKYKQALLGGGDAKDPFPNDPRRVIVTELALVVQDREDVTLDLTGDLSKLKDQVFVIKEGSAYKMRVKFFVQKQEIVSGLKYVQKTYRKGIKVDTSKFMVGSYPPKAEAHTWSTPIEDAPSGMLARGDYKVESLFTDDDKNEHLKWTWKFEIKKDWA
ncbi:rho GDP-dissociation inhibitor 1-like isoform X1 [Mytilus californianus]|uniref:rho GDP-dissociation inhibitor 1-like isoform X1 n=1 Tax=Mytilus californianus TaxID=6549 RepID=UPI002246A6F7|nr:rho GDP-dissociation inhibitor 1-like isoform X1 [Mytilus californianus]